MRFTVSQRLQTLLTRRFIQLAEVEPGHVHAGFVVHALARHAVDAREGGAQGFVTQDQRLQRGLKTPDIQQALEPRHAPHVVRRAVGFHLPQEPHALLRVRQRHRLATVDFFNRPLRITRARRLNQCHLGGKRSQFTGFKQRTQRQLHVTRLTHPRNDLRGQQRMPAQCKKVIAQTDARLPQHFTPDARDLLLQFCLRLDMFTHLPQRLRQCAPIQFAARAQRHGVQSQQLRGHHVLRQCLCQRSPHVLVVKGVSPVRGVVTDQLRPRGGFTNQDCRLRHAR